MINTKVIKVSCCGANELLNVEDVVDFLESNPQVEIGIGVSRERCSVGMPRFSWILDLQSRLSPEKGMSRIAFHVNGNWSKEIVENGTLPEELFYLLWRNKGIVRIQLNVIGSGHTFDNISVKPLADLITALSEKQIGRFIMPANKESFAFIKKLQTLTDEFDVLYDASFELCQFSIILLVYYLHLNHQRNLVIAVEIKTNIFLLFYQIQMKHHIKHQTHL